MPPHALLATALVDTLCFQQNEFKEWRDGADVTTQLPAIELRTKEGSLWPFVFVKQQGTYFCCMPLVETAFQPKERPGLLTLPSVTAAFSAIMAVIGFLGRPLGGITEDLPKLSELDTFLSVAAPFGRLQVTEPSVVTEMMESPDMLYDDPVKVPAWRPLAFQGKPSVSVSIKEVVHSTQCDRSDMQPTVSISGEVKVHCELERAQVLLHLKCPTTKLTPGNPDAVLVHPCVTVGSSLQEVCSSGEESAEKTFRFSPPNHPFVLCHYTFSRLFYPPVLGFYSMRGDKNVEFQLQLKLQDGIRNSFEAFEVKIPFYNRGHIKKSSLTPSYGTVFMSKDRFSLMWSVGTKFDNKSYEASLSGSVTFEEDGSAAEPRNPICNGNTCFVQLYFRMLDYTVSGLRVDPKAVQVVPPCKVKVHADRRTETYEYKIWNKFGELPFAVPKMT
uniref:AP-5 complex subunit mu-1 n=1 Tax=Ornithodoros turicata TaxID=34597 RepID=A0A2R5LJ13_9ACAR